VNRLASGIGILVFAIAGAAPPAAPRGPAPRVGTTSRQAPVRVGARIREPRRLKLVSPVYPQEAKEARVQGTVTLDCTIDRDGRVADVPGAAEARPRAEPSLSWT
jgi:protein TonB